MTRTAPFVLALGLVAGLDSASAQTSSPPAQTPSPPAQMLPTPAPSQNASAPSAKDLANSAKPDDVGEKDGVNSAVLRAEIMLDRLHASPGVIDGRKGANFMHALQVFERAGNLKKTEGLDAKVWAALLAQSGAPVLVDHVLTDKEVEGPFFPDLPKDYSELAKLKTIGYRSISQKIGAQFHMGEDLLAALNPGIDLSKAGTKIVVADVTPAAIHGTLKTIVVDKKISQVLAFDAKGRILAAYPATIGSRELPSPSGTYKVKGIAFNPIYYYDPENFLQGNNKEKLKLPPGPNNPVGSVFIALTKPTYGLHGTPDPSKIDKTASHGCVRMTNWDARELAHMVKRGIVVRFKE